MKWIMIVLPCFLFIGGCGEEFAAGFGTGAVSMAKMSNDAQDKFIKAVNELNAETVRLNAEIGAVKDIDIKTFVKPETIAAIESLKAQEKDPTLWIALASILLGGTGVNIFKNRKTAS